MTVFANSQTTYITGSKPQATYIQEEYLLLKAKTYNNHNVLHKYPPTCTILFHPTMLSTRP